VPIGIEEQEDRYRYCVNGTDFLVGECYNDVVEYTNWVDNYLGDNCAGLTLNGMSFVDDYGWDRENCASRHHFMCRVDCGEIPTPEPETTLAPTTVSTKEPATTISPWERQIEVVVVEGDFGEWQGEQKMCDENGYVCGLTTRYQEDKGRFNDNTALNGISMECCDYFAGEDNFPEIKVVSNGFEGDLIRQFNCGKFKYICGMRTRYAAKGQYSDETALNGLEVQCCDKYVWSSHETYVVNQGDWGEWQNNETKCPSMFVE